MAFKSLLLTGALAAATASAATIPSRDVSGFAYTYRLAANVTFLNVTEPHPVQGWELSYTNYNATTGTAELNFVAAGSGSVFYSTATGGVGLAHFTDSGSDVTAPLVVVTGGTATVPAGFPNLITTNSTGGSQTLAVGANPDDTNQAEGVAELFTTEGKWMVCPTDDNVILATQATGQRTLSVCADVQLIPICDHSEAVIDGSVDVQCQTSQASQY